MTFELQPSGMPSRTFQCLECERLDTMKSPVIAAILNALQPPKQEFKLACFCGT